MYGVKDKAVTLKDISSSQDIPVHFLGKIMQTLVKHKIVHSTKGPKGGFRLKKSAKTLKLIKVVEIIDGLDMFNVCGIGFKKCSDNDPCPLHNEFKIVKEEIRKLLSDKTVAELCNDVKSGKSVVSFTTK